MPMGTPPNAMAHETGLVRVRDFLRVGVPLTLFAAALGWAAALWWW